MTVQHQAIAFAAMALCGACSGMAHDLLGVFRRNALVAAIADFALGVFCAGSIVTAALYIRCDAFRLYTLLGVLMGWMIYAATLGMFLRVLRRRLRTLSAKRTK